MPSKFPHPLPPPQQTKADSLPYDNFLDHTKFKALADDKSSLPKMMISVFDKVKNIVEKGDNAGYQHFLLHPHCFSPQKRKNENLLGYVEFLVCEYFHSLSTDILSFGELYLILYQTKNFGLNQIKNICRLQYECSSYDDFCLW